MAFRILVSGASTLRRAGNILALEVVLKLANLLATLNPTLTLGFTALFSQLVQGGPVDEVVVLKLHITADGFQELLSRYVVTQVLVVLEFFPGGRVNERRDDLEEWPNIERRYDILAVLASKVWHYLQLMIRARPNRSG